MGLNLNPFSEPKKEKAEEPKQEQKKVNSSMDHELEYIDIDTLIHLAEDN